MPSALRLRSLQKEVVAVYPSLWQLFNFYKGLILLHLFGITPLKCTPYYQKIFYPFTYMDWECRFEGVFFEKILKNSSVPFHLYIQWESTFFKFFLNFFRKYSVFLTFRFNLLSPTHLLWHRFVIKIGKKINTYPKTSVYWIYY